ncbi:MAG: hypothetical protein M0Z34_07060 [Nitrospiraceae bacterium]|nr:hypothetical protein [Nitrospiraceae bacterium]
MTGEVPQAFCSFCLKAAADVAVLVAGPGVYICDGCVAFCAELVAGRVEPAMSREPIAVAPWAAEADLAAVLTAIPRVAESRNQADYALAQYVRRAREMGASWAEIAQSMGITRQSAWERFSGKA